MPFTYSMTRNKSSSERNSTQESCITRLRELRINMYSSTGKKREDGVVPIRFKTIHEDFGGEENQKATCEISQKEIKEQKIQPNFSFEYSYPAVVFNNVCFTVNKSQQQSNILDECFCKAKGYLKWFGVENSRQKIEILKSVNLSVPYGSIFGLLGPSSCGKTTLLRCLVGLLNPTSGDIKLFCQEGAAKCNAKDFWCCSKSHSNIGKNCKIPGANVGYMPQDLGLYEDFTIRQLLTMFGRYMKMTSKLIKLRIDFMSKFLDLPNIDRQISSLSGGQKRRVSFAIACLHMPPLIILDEPTVGVDPLLRQSIWKYLRRLADQENKTIIITTHYIEEAAQADQVALMRAGEILVQDSPSKIMESNGCKSLEEAFLKICNNVLQDQVKMPIFRTKLYPQPRFNWFVELNGRMRRDSSDYEGGIENRSVAKFEPQELMLSNQRTKNIQLLKDLHSTKLNEQIIKLSMEPNNREQVKLARLRENHSKGYFREASPSCDWQDRIRIMKSTKNKLSINEVTNSSFCDDSQEILGLKRKSNLKIISCISRSLILIWALLYKNYRRNVNSIPLLAFQFMLPVIQMISFSLCVGGRPTNIGLGLVNLDKVTGNVAEPRNLLIIANSTTNVTDTASDYDFDFDSITGNESLSLKYLSFVDTSMITLKPYENLNDALRDVRATKLWAVMEIGENFTKSIINRFDLENFYQLEPGTIQQSLIRLYPDKSNKVLDMICHRSLVNSFRQFLLDQFDHFKRLPLEMKEPIFSIKANLISNSIDGYTESIAAGLLASLTYIMAAGLTTFIMVVERVDGILERTFTCGISPVMYLVAHTLFRSFVMMLQIAVVMFLTFYLLEQPLVGSIWLAYLILMTLNLTGITYGLLISSIVSDQNGAALTIVSSLVLKITLSGILWPFEAIPHWLRTICYIQPLTMPIQALKAITLKGSGLEDRIVQLGFLVSIGWLIIFLTISTKRFKFYQH